MKINLLFGSLLLTVACSTKNPQQNTMPSQASQSQETPVVASTANSAVASTASSPFYNFEVNTLEGQPVDLKKFKGKKILVVNTASECGYTPQYAQLQELYEKHGDKVVVLGFPANNFGGQEPGSSEEIAEFCQKNYGVTFPMFEKVSVKGEDQHPLFSWLSDKSKNGVVGESPSWNFCKYLLDEQGQVVAFFPSKVKPMDEAILAAIR